MQQPYHSIPTKGSGEPSKGSDANRVLQLQQELHTCQAIVAFAWGVAQSEQRYAARVYLVNVMMQHQLPVLAAAAYANAMTACGTAPNTEPCGAAHSGAVEVVRSFDNSIRNMSFMLRQPGGPSPLMQSLHSTGEGHLADRDSTAWGATSSAGASTNSEASTVDGGAAYRVQHVMKIIRTTFSPEALSSLLVSARPVQQQPEMDERFQRQMSLWGRTVITS